MVQNESRALFRLEDIRYANADTRAGDFLATEEE